MNTQTFKAEPGVSTAAHLLRVAVTFAIWLAAGEMVVARAASAATAQKHFEAGKYAAAQAEYQKLLRETPEDSRLSYNAATAAYKRGDLTNAVLGFEEALATQDLKLQQKAYYNLGNSQYQLGDKAGSPDEKIAHWEESIKHFGSALQLQPEDADAKHNQALVQRLLEELKKQQPKQSSKQDNKNDDKKDDKKEDSDKNDSKDGSQDQQSKDSEKQQKQDEKDGSKDKQDSQSQDDAQQQQQQQQDGQESKDDSKEGKGDSEQGKDSESGGKDKAGQSKPDAQAQKEAEEERKAAALGKMTPQMAEKLLDAQKSNEKAIPFRVTRQETRKGKERSFKNW